MGIISGFIGGTGDAAAKAGEMLLADKIRRESDEANALRDGNLKTSEREAAQEWQSGESALDRESAETVASTKKSGKDTSQIKNAKWLMSQGMGKIQAQNIAMKAQIKHTDKEGNQIVMMPDESGNFVEVGKIIINQAGDQEWVPTGGQTENAEVTSQHRKAASKATEKKAGWTTGDEEDFPETGGDRKAWKRNEAQRIANEERAAKKGGIVNAVSKPAKSAALAPVKNDSPYPDGTELKGKDGKTYIVENGKPVLKNPQ